MACRYTLLVVQTRFHWESRIINLVRPKKTTLSCAIPTGPSLRGYLIVRAGLKVVCLERTDSEEMLLKVYNILRVTVQLKYKFSQQPYKKLV